MSKKILLIDDEPQEAMPVEWVLRREGYDVFICPTFEEACNIIKNESPDLILLDIMFPYENQPELLNPRAGIDFLKELKSNDNQAKSIPVIIMTIRGEREIENECFDCGAAGYIRKMAATSVLVEKANELIGKPDENKGSQNRTQKKLSMILKIINWWKNERKFEFKFAS